MIFLEPDDYMDYNGEPIPDEEFERYAARACEAVDMACHGAITRAGGLRGMNADIRPLLKQAACIQAEYLLLNGIETATDGNSAMDGYYIGKTSVVLHAGSRGGKHVFPAGLCEKAYALLLHTGLLYGGAAVL